jgi:hypothetical protein
MSRDFIINQISECNADYNENIVISNYAIAIPTCNVTNGNTGFNTLTRPRGIISSSQFSDYEKCIFIITPAHATNFSFNLSGKAAATNGSVIRIYYAMQIGNISMINQINSEGDIYLYGGYNTFDYFTLWHTIYLSGGQEFSATQQFSADNAIITWSSTRGGDVLSGDRGWNINWNSDGNIEKGEINFPISLSIPGPISLKSRYSNYKVSIG